MAQSVFPRQRRTSIICIVVLSATLSAVPTAMASAPTKSAYDETAGMYEVMAFMASSDGPSLPEASGSAAVESRASEDASSPVTRVRGASERFVSQLGAHTAASPFTPRDAGMMGLAAAVLAGSGALTFLTGLVRGRPKVERYDEL